MRSAPASQARPTRFRRLAVVGLLCATACASDAPRAVDPAEALFDPNPSERTEAVAAVAASKDMRWLGRLVELLDDPDPAVRALSHQALESLTGRTSGYAAYAPEDMRRPFVAEWRAWLATREQGPAPVPGGGGR